MIKKLKSFMKKLKQSLKKKEKLFKFSLKKTLNF